MKLTTMFNPIRNANSEKLRMHDLNYQLPKKEEKEYWYKECIAHPTNSHSKFIVINIGSFLGILTLDFYISTVLKLS